MSMEKLPDVDIQICLGIMRLGEIENDKLTAERMAALIQLAGQVRWYLKEFNGSPLALAMCEKKIDFIIQAKTKTDLKEILLPAKVRYDFNEVVPVGKWHVEQEEIMIWSLTSFHAPLVDVAFKRYMKLMKKYFPEFTKDLGND